MIRKLLSSILLAAVFMGCSGGGGGPDGGARPDGGTRSCTGMPTSTLCGSACANLQSDARNCGRCGNVCPSGQACTSGACAAPTQTCPAGQMRCGTACTSTASDASNCGACGNRCAAGQSCVMGACTAPPATCAAPFTMCGTAGSGGRCTDTQNDPGNCGACGNACAANQRCLDGACYCVTGLGGIAACGDACVNTNTDSANCGGCGVACTAGQTCSGGACQTFPGAAAGAACASSGECRGALLCEMGFCACRISGQSCQDSGDCCGGGTCVVDGSGAGTCDGNSYSGYDGPCTNDDDATTQCGRPLHCTLNHTCR